MNKLVKKYPMLGSSANPEKLSLTIKGVLVGLIPLLVFVLGQLKVEVTADDLLNLVELGAGAVGAVMVFIGAVRKIVKKNQN